jgi:hypothetical protein
MLISIEGTGKYQLETSQENMSSPDLSPLFFANIFFTKTKQFAGALS